MLNAMIFWGRKREVPLPGSKEFERLLDISNCRYTGATNIQDACFIYGIKMIPIHPSLDVIQKCLDNNMPVGLEVAGRGGGTDINGDPITHMITVVGYSGIVLHVVNMYQESPEICLTYIEHHKLDWVERGEGRYTAIAYKQED